MRIEQLCSYAKEASYKMQDIDCDKKNAVLLKVADALAKQADKILTANSIDMEHAKGKLKEGMLDRLKLDADRIGGMAEGLKKLVKLPDPCGEIIESMDRPNGLKIKKVRVALGVIGIIYEARPNVTSDSWGICFKSGNVTILKGGSDAINTNKAIVDIIKSVIREEGIDEHVLQLIESTDRETTVEMMHMDKYIDCIIPRGSAGLIKTVVTESTIPVIETGSGNCHVYIDEDADIAIAIPVIINAKTSRIGVCNSIESLVVHSKIADACLPRLRDAFAEHHVEVRADKRARTIIPEWKQATEADFSTEYLDLIISVKVVDSIEEAIEHINRCSTHHSESIISKNPEHIRLFEQKIDSACVYANASTRFTDGDEFGFGAEIGISTQKLHARGPMGLKELTSYKYIIEGSGQVR